VAPDSALKSTADLKGKTIAISPAWTEPYRPATGPTFVWQELKAAGLDPTKDVTLVRIPWGLFLSSMNTSRRGSRRASSTR
jgi:ABC-type nitrate/sulfonate/bicarbonate transport system substrate-binding protein